MAEPVRPLRRPFAAAAFTAMAAYMLFSPALPQLFGTGAPMVRQWTMFSGVGVGLPKGTFRIEYADGRTEDLSPLEVAGMTRYPVRRPIYRFDGYAKGPEGLAHFAAATCTTLPEGARLTFDGVLAERRHWTRMEAMRVCEVPA